MNSKQIRRRQAAAEARALRPVVARRVQGAPTDEEIDRVLAYHGEKMLAAIAAGDSWQAGWCAHQAAQYWRVARAMRIARDHRRAFWKAMLIARHELYNCEI